MIAAPFRLAIVVACVLAPALLAAVAADAMAQSPSLRIGLVLPDQAPAGAAAGAQLGADESSQAAQLLRGEVTLLVRTATDSAKVAAAADSLVRLDRVTVLIGAFDAPSFAALREAASRHRVLLLNAGWRGDAARASCHPLVFHIAASDRMHGDALALWRAARRDTGSAPASTAPTAAAADVLLWHGALERFGAGQLNDRYRLRFGTPMEPAAWATWMAVKVAWEAAARSRSADGAVLAAFLQSGRARFDGHKGVVLSFRDWDHQLRQPLHVLRAGDAGPPDDVPRAAPGEQLAPRDLLDRLGGSSRDIRCSL